MAGGSTKENKLQPSAKAFVPGKSWKPAAGGNAAPAKGNSGGDAAPAPQANNGSAAKLPAPAPPVASAWGKAPSNAIRAAPPPNQPKPASARPQQVQRGSSRGSSDSNGWKKQKGGKGGGGGDGGGNWARGKNRRQSSGAGRDSQRQSSSGGPKDDGDGWKRGKSLPVELLKPGEGTTDDEKKVTRIRAEDLLAMRLSFVSPPLSWGQGDNDEPGPPEACLWDAPTRISEITAVSKGSRMGGDVSAPNRNRRASQKGKQQETAPPLEECKPLEVNDETRWKANVFDKDKKKKAEDEDSDEVVLRKAFVILNKLSLTKFDKLSDDFINTGIGRNEHCLQGAIGLIVNKAQDEPHFSAMYAALCLKLAKTPMEGIEDPKSSKKGKRFKKLLLQRCQEEFEQDTATKIAKATEGIEDEEEREYEANKVKKHYLGHMRFIGELYKGDLISIKIMLLCLPALLEGETAPPKEGEEKSPDDDKENENEIDEEKVECFAKLMTVIGGSLEAQSEAMKSVGKTDVSEKLNACWATVEIMAGKRKEKKKKGPNVSNRIKFMLLDLIEMREKGWVTRRKEETAKTLAQIHKEVAKEERAAKRSSSSNSLRSLSSSGNIRKQGSSGSLRNMGESSKQPQVDADGFVSVKKGSMGRSMSMNDFKRGNLPDGSNFRRGSSFGIRDGGKKTDMKRSTSSGGAFAAFNEPAESSSGRRKSDKKERSDSKQSNAPKRVDSFSVPEDAPAPAPSAPTKQYLSANECGDKAKNILKEYFVGGDTDDAVLSFDELIGAGKDGSIDRGAKVVESSCLLVLEMKAEDVDKFLSIALRCIKENKLEGKAITTGLNDPIEFLSDIVIDAPLAGDHLANIVAEFVKSGAISFDFLLNTPDYFRTDGNAAQFGVKVLKKIGGDALESEANVEVIAKLMTDEDKEQYPTAKELMAA